MNWRRKEIDREEVKRVAKRFDCDALTASILTRRNLASGTDARFFLSGETGLLHNPFLLAGMEAAVDRIRAAIARGEPVHVFGDRDVDGVSSVVLLRESIMDLGGTVHCSMPEGDDEYGLTEKWVRRIHEGGDRLIVTVDCGISCHREVALAAELGVDCIVTDHHNAPEELPRCVAVLDPKIDGAGYPFRELSGCGLTWKLDWALHFASLPEYGRDFRLLVARPANDSVAIDAVHIRNLAVVDSISENIMPGLVPYPGSRLERFLGDAEVLVYDIDAARRSFESAFGVELPSMFRDFSPELWKASPALEGKSLLRILEASSTGRYLDQPAREIDLLQELYVGHVLELGGDALRKAFARLDLVALGTLSDLMILRDENRILVRRGMALIGSAPRRGLRELLSNQGLLGKRLTTKDIAWKVTPVLNAAGRMGEPARALELFLAESMEEAASRADVLLELNRRRKALGDKVWEECRSDAASSLEKTGGRFLMVSGPRIHWGITGILAARLAGAYRAPALVVAVQEDKCIGSVRGPEGYSLSGFLDHFDDILSGYGGHDYAAGFSLAPDRLAAFTERFYEVAASVDLKAVAEETLDIDAEIPLSYLSPKLVEVVDRFEPFGEGNPPLTFLTRGFVVEAIERIGKGGSGGAPHVRLLLGAERNKWPAVYWNGADRIRDKLVISQKVDVVYRVERNHYMNMENLRLSVVDLSV